MQQYRCRPVTTQIGTKNKPISTTSASIIEEAIFCPDVTHRVKFDFVKLGNVYYCNPPERALSNSAPIHTHSHPPPPT